ncbi:protein RUBCNL-like isoform X3 [Larimichthys crocea]|uniref:protein RUBCNL-like isoform X3 n=1 Tax=Larimichthys crocea TaxID=215358 RepID=UPI000F5F203F|nr:protein RUBCNL-like isoform X3 [Larimichthys crocea]
MKTRQSPRPLTGFLAASGLGLCKMMGSCGGVSSSLQRSRYISWCEDPAESLTPVTTALTATALNMFLHAEEFSHQDNQSAGFGSVPHLLLSPAETAGGETNATFSHQRTKPTLTRRTAITQSHHFQLKSQSSSALHNADRTPDGHADEGGGGTKGILSGPEADNWNTKDSSLLHPEGESFLLPRSSPVISRRHRPVSWHGDGTDTSAPSSLDSSGSPLDQCWHPSVTSVEDLGSEPSSCHHSSQLQEDKKPRSISVLSNLFSLLSAGLHHPIGGSAEEHRGKGLTSCNAPYTSERTSSGIPEFTADTFKTSCELEKENAHFIVVDMVLEVLEGVKWTLSFTHQHTHCEMCVKTHESCHGVGEPRHEKNTTGRSDENTHSSYVHTHQHTQDEEEEEAGHDEAEQQPKTFSVLSTDSGFEDCGLDPALTQRDTLKTAEWLAKQLVLEFRTSWLPSREPRRGRLSLRSSLQELPGTGHVTASGGSLTEEIRLRTNMRGSLNWAPPRFQIIFTVQPTHRRSDVVSLQHFLCAGCGTEVEPKYIKKLRYCEYLGRYFCDCCHSGSEAVIPGRVLSCWDFGRYPVSDFSKQLLDSVWHQPLFDLTCVGKTLYSRVKELDKFRKLQDQLLYIKKLLKACRLSGSVMAEFDQLPAHLTEQLHLFSMDDLSRVKKGQLTVQVKAVLNSAIHHVENCELCLARGFICEFCRKRDVIFPFQSGICKRCPVCKACFHKHCFVEKKCPKCARIQSRKKRPDEPSKSD